MPEAPLASEKRGRGIVYDRRFVFARKVVGVPGFEPGTSWSQTRRAAQLRYTPATTNIKMIRATPPTYKFRRHGVGCFRIVGLVGRVGPVRQFPRPPGTKGGNHLL